MLLYVLCSAEFCTPVAIVYRGGMLQLLTPLHSLFCKLTPSWPCAVMDFHVTSIWLCVQDGNPSVRFFALSLAAALSLGHAVSMCADSTCSSLHVVKLIKPNVRLEDK